MIFDHIYLSKVEEQWPTILAWATFWQLMTVLSSLCFRQFSFYQNLSRENKVQWDIRVSAFIHATLISVLALRILEDQELAENPLFGYSEASGRTYAIACGYFLWDSLICLWHLKTYGVGFLVHGVACLSVYLFSFGPFANYFGAVFLLFELSTPFLNINWFLNKTGMAGSALQLVNGIMLVITFLFLRLIFGVAMSIIFFKAIYMQFELVPTFHLCLYGVSNIVLNCLNFVWFSKIIKLVSNSKSKESFKTAGHEKVVKEE